MTTTATQTLWRPRTENGALVSEFAIPSTDKLRTIRCFRSLPSYRLVQHEKLELALGEYVPPRAGGRLSKKRFERGNEVNANDLIRSCVLAEGLSYQNFDKRLIETGAAMSLAQADLLIIKRRALMENNERPDDLGFIIATEDDEARLLVASFKGSLWTIHVVDFHDRTDRVPEPVDIYFLDPQL